MQHWKGRTSLFTLLLVWLISSESVSENQYRAVVSSAHEKELQNCTFPSAFNLLLTPCNEREDNISLSLQRNDVIDAVGKDNLLYSVKTMEAVASIFPVPGGVRKFSAHLVPARTWCKRLTGVATGPSYMVFFPINICACDGTAYYQDTRNGAYIAIQCLKKSELIVFHGVVYHEGLRHLISSLLDLPKDHAKSISEPCGFRLTPHPAYHDTRTFQGPLFIYHYRASDHLQPFSEVSSSRNIRDVTGSVASYTVEVLVVVDYSVYRRWLLTQDGQTSDTNVLQTKLEIQNYYTQVMNGVDLRYRNIGFADFGIRIKPAGFVIADSAATFPWTMLQTGTQTSRGQLNANEALKDFRNWLNKTKSLSDHDHAVLFTAHDLYTVKADGGRIVKHTSGLAFIGTMCHPGDSISIVEEQGGFQSVGTVAHEIGHSLGARHDGEDNICRSEDRFIMASSGIGPIPFDKRYNPWHFSNCSVEYFRDFIASLLANDSLCLTDSTTKDNEGHDTSMPGQIYDADKQCRLIWGSGSYLCRGAEFGNASTICTAMYCRDPSTVNDCVLHTAARGTSCGSKQWCVEGKCVYSKDAPKFEDGCVLGDQPGAAFNAMSCDQLLNQSPSYCYQAKVVARCCSSCQRHFTWRKGCEYGDRVQGCKPWHCNHIFSSRDILSDCCRTCNVGDVILPTMQPNWDIETQSAPMPVSECNDKDLDCPSLMETNGKYMCYSSSVSTLCCETCRRHIDGFNLECPFGDRSPNLCAKISNVTSLFCSKYRTQCCFSCYNESSRASDLKPVPVDSVHFVALVIYIFNHVIK